jgi:hypothetical protein
LGQIGAWNDLRGGLPYFIATGIGLEERRAQVQKEE